MYIHREQYNCVPAESCERDTGGVNPQPKLLGSERARAKLSINTYLNTDMNI